MVEGPEHYGGPCKCHWTLESLTHNYVYIAGGMAYLQGI